MEIADRVVEAHWRAGGLPWVWRGEDPLRRRVLELLERGETEEVLVEAARRLGANEVSALAAAQVALERELEAIKQERGAAEAVARSAA